MEIDKIEGTVSFLKKLGINKIILVGPSPEWYPSLPKVLFLSFKNDPMHRLPERMWSGLDESIQHLDKYMHEKADRLDITYVSPFNALCNTEGCLTRLGDKPKDLVIGDGMHFTPSGSRFFINSVLANMSLDK